ncbi:MAG: hypothetical protein R3E86_03730 [Pseudomonadales bacterium]
MSRNGRFVLWGGAGLFYAVFCLWYTNLGGPLTAPEIERFSAILETRHADPAQAQRLRAFMAADDGNQFLMLNALDLAERPSPPPGAPAGVTGQDLLDRYMTYMLPALLKRACHPVFAGRALADAVDLVGVADGAHWDQGALVRYRSLRDMLEIALDPAFQGPHADKLAALEKTIAYPLQPQLYLSDPRLLLALVLLVAVLLLDRRRTNHG